MFKRQLIFDSNRYNKTEKLPVEEFARFDFILLGSINKAGFNDNLARANVTSHHENYFKVEAFHKVFRNNDVIIKTRDYSFRLAGNISQSQVGSDGSHSSSDVPWLCSNQKFMY